MKTLTLILVMGTLWHCTNLAAEAPFAPTPRRPVGTIIFGEPIQSFEHQTPLEGMRKINLLNPRYRPKQSSLVSWQTPGLAGETRSRLNVKIWTSTGRPLGSWAT